MHQLNHKRELANSDNISKEFIINSWGISELIDDETPEC